MEKSGQWKHVVFLILRLLLLRVVVVLELISAVNGVITQHVTTTIHSQSHMWEIWSRQSTWHFGGGWKTWGEHVTSTQKGPQAVNRPRDLYFLFYMNQIIQQS